MTTDTLSARQAEELASIRDECEAIIGRIDRLMLADTEGKELDAEGDRLPPT
jgi:hypothetical protein